MSDIDDEFNAIIRAQLMEPEPINSAARGFESRPAAVVHTESGPSKPARSGALGKFLREWSIVIIIAVGVSFGVRVFLFAPFYIPSTSMEPTLLVDDKILINKMSYRLHDVNRGDVVVFKRPAAGTFDADVKDLVKRVIALPGETMEIRNQKIYINGGLLEEPYTNGAPTVEGFSEKVDPDHDGKVTIPDNSYFVMGDNRCQSCSQDSRFWGFLDEDLIEGRAFVTYWPKGSWKWL